MSAPDPAIVRALSVRQPYAEQILRGEKRFEYRSTDTKVRERVFIYASSAPADDPDAWRAVGHQPGALPSGVIVGAVDIVETTAIPEHDMFAWHLAYPRRLSKPVRSSKKPLPVFWLPEVSAAQLNWVSDPGLMDGTELVYHYGLAAGMDEMLWSLLGVVEAGVHSERDVPAAIGRKMWIIASFDDTEKTFIAGWLRVDEIEQGDEQDGVPSWYYRGTAREIAAKPTELVEITNADWLEDLERYLSPDWDLELASQKELLKKLDLAWQTKKA